MSRGRFARNVTSNWATMVVAIGWGIVLVPFFLRSLGAERYGVWLLVNSIVGYYGMLDLGVHGAVVRHTARAMGRERPDDVNRVVNTAFWVQTALAAAALVVAVVVAVVVPRIPGFAAAEHPDAGILFLLAGSATALAFAGSTFRGVLVAAERFDLSNGIRIAMTAIQNVAYMVALSRDAGLVALASILLAVTVLEKPVTAFVAFRTVPTLRFAPRLFDRAQTREIFGYGVHGFLVNLGSRLRLFSDAVVIGSFMPASAVTMFNLGSRPLQYLLRGVRAISGVLTPAFSRGEAADESGARVARLLTLGTRTTALIATLGCLVLVVAGDRILRLWLGQDLPESFLVLLILAPAYWFETALAPTGSAVLATRRYRVSSAAAIGEGLANLVISLALVGRLGLVGVALGTAIPMVAVRLFILPWVACELAGLRLRSFLAGVWLPVVPATLAAAGTGWILRRAVDGVDVVSVAILAGGVTVVYGVVALITLRLADDELLPAALRRPPVPAAERPPGRRR